MTPNSGKVLGGDGGGLTERGSGKAKGKGKGGWEEGGGGGFLEYFIIK